MKYYIKSLLLAVFLLVLCGCSRDPAMNANGMHHPMQFYYCGTTAGHSSYYERPSGAMQWEYRDLGKEPRTIEAVLQMYLDGPISNTLRSPVPEGTSVQEVFLENGILTIVFNDAFFQLSGVDLTTAASCLVHTMVQYPDVGSVCLQTDTGMVTGLTGRPLETDDFLKQEDVFQNDYAAFRVYFPNREERYLRVEKRYCLIDNADDILNYVTQQLIAGSQSPSAAPAVPAGTRLLDVRNDNGFCTVNFSAEFIQNAPEESLRCRSQLLAIVNTLTDLDGVKYVSFLCEGETVSAYGPLELPVYLKRAEESVEPDDPSAMQEVTLFVPAGREGKLAPVPAYVRRMSGNRMEAEVLKMLFELKDDNGYNNVIPKDTTVVDLQCKYRICSLTLSDSFLSCDHDPEIAQMAIRSIVATLCELDTVDWVQIKVSGGEMASVDLSKNFTKDESWIIP